MVTTRSPRVGVTISALELCVVRSADGSEPASPRRFPLEPFAGDSSSWGSLMAAFHELSTGGMAGGTLAVALMPPLVEVRTLELPPLREDELRPLVARNASRYFVAARGAQLVAIAGARSKIAGPIVAAAAPVRLIAAIHSAARDAGFRIASVAPAESAWAVAARSLWPAFAQRTGSLLVMHADRTDLVQSREGRVGAVRRFRPGASDAEHIAQAINESSDGPTPAAVPRVGAVGAAEGRRELTRALSALGITVNSASSRFVEVAEQPDRLAAAFAFGAVDLVLRPDDVRAEMRDRERRFAIGIGVATALLLVLAGTFELWGVHRQLDRVVAARVALRSQLSTTLVGRTSVETVYRQLATLSAAERASPQWTVLLVGLAQHLDEEAYLTAFRGRGDSVVVEGIATHAAQVFADLERIPGLADVQAAAPVRREAPNGSDATERFTIAAHMSDIGPKAPSARGAQ